MQGLPLLVRVWHLRLHPQRGTQKRRADGPRRGLREKDNKDNREEPERTAQEIKKNYEAREAEQVNREMDELLEVLRPAMERNVKRKREEIKRKNRAERRKRVAASRKRRVNRFLSEAGIPLRVL